jgi:mRNA interferase MazF
MRAQDFAAHFGVVVRGAFHEGRAANAVQCRTFEVLIPAGGSVSGVILADHQKSIDWKARRAEPLGHCSNEVMDEVRAKLAPPLGYEAQNP